MTPPTNDELLAESKVIMLEAAAEIERLTAALAAAVAEERERCALLCEDWASVRTPDHGGMALLNVAAAMRRGQSAHGAPAAPPQREREPLTDEQARTHCTLWPGSTDAARKAWLLGFRAAERAHGITKEQT